MSTRTLRILTWLLVAAIAAIAFAVSFEAISQYAVASAVSIALNVAHAPRTLAAQLVAALPPAALLASLELVLSEARRLRTAPASAGPTAPTTPAGAEPATTTAPASELAAGAARTSRELVRELLTSDGEVTAERVMEATGVGRRRAYELLAQVRAEGNGHGAG